MPFVYTNIGWRFLSSEHSILRVISCERRGRGGIGSTVQDKGLSIETHNCSLSLESRGSWLARDSRQREIQREIGID